MMNAEECKNVKHKKCPCTITPGGAWRLVLLVLSPLPMILFFLYVLYCFIRVNQDSIKDLRDQNIELLGRIHCLEQRLKP